MASKIDAVVGKFHELRFVKPRGWNRDAIIAFFARKSGEALVKLPAYSDTELSPEGIARNAPRGWLVPREAFTRAVKVNGKVDHYEIVAPDESLKNSLRAFLRDNVVENLATAAAAAETTVPEITPDSFELHLHGEGEHAFVMVYRRK